MEKLSNYQTNRIDDKIFDIFKHEETSKERLLANFDIIMMIKALENKDTNQENISSRILGELEEIKLLTDEECSLQLHKVLEFYKTLM